MANLFPSSALLSSSLNGNFLFHNNSLLYFGSSVTPEDLPDFDINCGNLLIPPVPVVKLDAWLVAFDLSTSVSESHLPLVEYTIFPNPNNGSFQLQFPFSTIEKQLFVYNINGEEIYTTPIYETEKAVIVLPNLPNGIYYVALTGKDLFYASELRIFQ